LIFPHHECEIAQSRGATGADSFARFWMHARFLMVEGEKMSKSKGNFWTVRDVLEGRATGVEVHPAVLRLELLKSHYRSNMNFTRKGLQDSAGVVKRLQDLRTRLEAETSEPAEVDLTHPVLEAFGLAIADDLNIAGALGAILPWASGEHPNAAESLGVLNRINSVLAVAPLGEESEEDSEGEDDINERCAALDAARAAKDWGTADSVRDQIIAAGYDVKTTPEGTVAEKKLA
jgi:cysteinyl-tRNA synthetase